MKPNEVKILFTLWMLLWIIIISLIVSILFTPEPTKNYQHPLSNRHKFLYIDKLEGIEILTTYGCSEEESKIKDKISHQTKVQFISEVECKGSDEYHIGTEYVQIKYGRKRGWIQSFSFEIGEGYLKKEKIHHIYRVENQNGIALFSERNKKSKLQKRLLYKQKAEVLQIVDSSDAPQWRKILDENKTYWIYEPYENFKLDVVE